MYLLSKLEAIDVDHFILRFTYLTINFCRFKITEPFFSKLNFKINCFKKCGRANTFISCLLKFC